MVSVDSEDVPLLIHRTDRNSINIYEDDDLKAVTTMKMEIAGPARKVSTNLSDRAASRFSRHQSWVRHAASPWTSKIRITSTEDRTRKSEFHCSCGSPHCIRTLLREWCGDRENEDIMLLCSNKHGGRSHCTDCGSTEVQPSKHSIGTSWKLRQQTDINSRD
jgi:hypothetical protein